MEDAGFLGVGRIAPQPAWQLAAHSHSTRHEMICVVSGNIETHIRGQVLRGGPGDVLFYPRDEVHAERAVGSPMLETLYVTFAMPRTPQWCLMRHDRNGRIEYTARWMLDFFSPRQQNISILGVLLQALLHEYSYLHAGREDDLFDVAKRYCQEHLSEPLDLDDLAQVSGLSRFHFSRRFHRSVGVSPMRYLREVRVQHARTLLLTTDWPLKAIAAHCGFQDAYQLSKTFKQVTGLSPSALR